jgi:hypothetical protein
MGVGVGVDMSMRTEATAGTNMNGARAGTEATADMTALTEMGGMAEAIADMGRRVMKRGVRRQVGGSVWLTRFISCFEVDGLGNRFGCCGRIVTACLGIVFIRLQLERLVFIRSMVNHQPRDCELQFLPFHKAEESEVNTGHQHRVHHVNHTRRSRSPASQRCSDSWVLKLPPPPRAPAFFFHFP